MNKYIFPIIKWKIKPWLKYYILNKRLAPSYPLSEIIEGTSPLTLENSVRKKFNIFNVGGNTKQATLPNPDFPIEVENVSGDVNVKVENKNLCSSETIGNNSPVLSNISGHYTGAITIAVKTSSGAAQVNYRIVYEDGTIYNNYIMLANSANNVWNKINYTTTKPIAKIGLYYISTGGTRTAEHIMFLKGTYTTITDADYLAHAEQTATLHLPEGMEMCKIGTYQDSFVYQGGKWYKNKKIAKVVLDGTEDWKAHGTISSWFYVDNIMNFFANINKNDFALCNYFIQEKYSDVLTMTNGKFALGISGNEGNYRAVFKCEDFLTVEGWKSFLSTKYSNNTPVIVKYALNTPQLQEITDTILISELESLKNLYSYKGTTYISSSNTPSPVFEVQYYMEGGDV